MRVAVLLVLACGAFAQDILRVDLSGAWRISSDDQPAYALPSFDDSQWKSVSVPRGDKYIWGTSYWLRRSVELPAGVRKTPLALTFGTIHDVYEVYVDGRRIGGTGNFESFGDARIPRPRTFVIPPGVLPESGPVPIALHVRGALFFHPDWRLSDVGPWEITNVATAPVHAAEQQIQERQVVLASTLWFSAAFLILALVSLAAWVAQRTQRELFWFGLVCLARAGHAAYIYFAYPELRLFTPTGIDIGFGPGTFDNPLFGEFVLAALGIRKWWLHVLLWGGWILSPLSEIAGVSGPGMPFTGLPANLWVGLLTVAVIVWEWRSVRAGLPLEQHVFRGVLLFSALSTVQVWIVLIRQQIEIVPGSAFHLRPPQFFLGQYQVKPGDLIWLAVSAMILLLLFRRGGADRRERQRLAGEFEAARVIQRLLLNTNIPPDPTLQFDAVYAPAQEVGGDFYYALDGRTILLGDVSGKGLKAAMLVSLLIGVLRNTTERRPGKVLATLNAALAGQTDGGFVTCCCVHLTSAHQAIVANAGHVAPYLDGTEAVVETALPLGLDEGTAYAESTLDVGAGTALTLVSDGVVEAANAKGELFGFERTAAIATLSAGDIASAARAWGQNDDITVVTVRRTA